jgi:signal transduction histidine kinase
MTHPSVQELARVDLFADLEDAQLQLWADAAEVVQEPAGVTIRESGQILSGVILLLDGTIEALLQDNGNEAQVSDHVAPTWIGAIPTIMETPLQITLRARSDVRLATIEPDRFFELVVAHRPVFRRVMAQVRPVIGRITRVEQNRERLASLGTMAAGLAHELNNPASAARRSADELSQSLAVLSSTIASFVETGLERTEAGRLVELQQEALAAAERPEVDELERADAEDELTGVLTELGVGGAWNLSTPLAAAGVDRAFVERIRDIAGPATEATVRWIAASLSARKLAAELAESTERMSKLVKAIKVYAYMDRGEIVQVDVREGLESTLIILGHKLKHTEITVNRDYDPALGKLTVHGAELNQVWTNLLANAIDALGDEGEIIISTRADGDCAEIDIADNGPGIPAGIRDQVFDPFFTTKDVGQGTGLGLDLARRIVVEHHHGSLTLDSHPGRTVFRVRLPLNGTNP